MVDSGQVRFLVPSGMLCPLSELDVTLTYKDRGLIRLYRAIDSRSAPSVSLRSLIFPTIDESWLLGIGSR
jgi:hypothetical protein